MNLRYASTIKTRVNSSGKYSYIISTKVVPTSLCDSSSYSYSSSNSAYQAALSKIRELGYEVFRGSDLTSTFIDEISNTPTDEFYAAISSGDFSNIFVGDYFTLSLQGFEVQEILPDVEFCKTCGQELPSEGEVTYSVNPTPSKPFVLQVADIDFINNSIVLLPKQIFGLYGIHTTEDDITYTDSFFYQNIRETIYSNLYQVFGNHIKKSSLNLPSINQIYGVIDANLYTSESTNSQLSLFLTSSTNIDIDKNYWLRDKQGTKQFYYVTSDGHLNYSLQTNIYGMRPVFTIM